MLRPYLHTCGCPSPSPEGSPLQCNQHAWVSITLLTIPSPIPFSRTLRMPFSLSPQEFTKSRITASNNRYCIIIRAIDTTLTRKRGDLGRLRDDVRQNPNLLGEWGREIQWLEKDIGGLEAAREDQLAKMLSYEVLAKGEYQYGENQYGEWKKEGP